MQLKGSRKGLEWASMSTILLIIFIIGFIAFLFIMKDVILDKIIG